MTNNFFKTIASAFVVQDDSTQQPVESKPTQIQTQSQTIVPNYNQQITPTQQISTPTDSGNEVKHIQMNETLFNKLCQKLESENLPGPDYMELKQAAMNESMVKLIPDEGTRFNLAFISLKAATPSLSKNTITNSIDTYISKLKEWEEESLSEIEVTRSEVDVKVARINELNDSLTKIKNEINTLQQDVTATLTKCDTNKSDMQNVVQFLVKKLSEDKQKIETAIN
jgi:hypothetical protein